MKRIAGASVALVLAVAGAACSTKPKATQITITTSEYTFNAPESFTGGLVELTLDNSSGGEPHEAELALLDEGKTLADYQAALDAGGPPPEWAHAAGGPGPVSPGETAVYTANFAAGTYVMVCHVPASDGQAHLEKGMVAETTVTEGEDGELPAADVTIETQEFAFVGAEDLAAGEQTVHVTNAGEQPHHIAMFALTEGKTAADLTAFFGADAPSGPPPFAGIPGLVATMAPGSEMTRTLELDAGTTVALICFIPDANDPKGTPHFAKGMLTEVTVGEPEPATS